MLKQISDILGKKKNTDSPIEELIYCELIKYDLKPIPQYQVGVFFIDLAFPEIKLAIEADGREFHSTRKQKESDKYREDKLKKLGWSFERFSGSFIHKHKDFIAAKIALKYFQEKLSEKQKALAVGRVVSFFTAKDIEFASELVKVFENGYTFRKPTEKYE